MHFMIFIDNNSWKKIVKNIFIHYLSYINIKMLCEYESSFIENASSKSNASVALIRDELKDELILWSKNDEMNKIQMKKAQKNFKQWWYLTSFETKNVNLKNENKLRVMKWKDVNQTNNDWHNFIECARATNDVSRLLCRRCDEDITHLSSMRTRTSAKPETTDKIECDYCDYWYHFRAFDVHLIIADLNLVIVSDDRRV
jgi:hypothetical protein